MAGNVVYGFNNPHLIISDSRIKKTFEKRQSVHRFLVDLAKLRLAQGMILLSERRLWWQRASKIRENYEKERDK